MRAAEPAPPRRPRCGEALVRPPARPRRLGPRGPGPQPWRQDAATPPTASRAQTRPRPRSDTHGTRRCASRATSTEPGPGPSFSFAGFSRPACAHARAPHRPVPRTRHPRRPPRRFRPVPQDLQRAALGSRSPPAPPQLLCDLRKLPVSLGLGPLTGSQLTKRKSKPWKTHFSMDPSHHYINIR